MSESVLTKRLAGNSGSCSPASGTGRHRRPLAGSRVRRRSVAEGGVRRAVAGSRGRRGGARATVTVMLLSRCPSSSGGNAPARSGGGWPSRGDAAGAAAARWGGAGPAAGAARKESKGRAAATRPGVRVARRPLGRERSRRQRVLRPARGASAPAACVRPSVWRCC